eukprot:6903940-Prymnesium_polylepis.1
MRFRRRRFRRARRRHLWRCPLHRFTRGTRGSSTCRWEPLAGATAPGATLRAARAVGSTRRRGGTLRGGAASIQRRVGGVARRDGGRLRRTRRFDRRSRPRQEDRSGGST